LNILSVAGGNAVAVGLAVVEPDNVS